MKKLFYSIVVATIATFTTNAQVTCNASYSSSASSTNTLKITFINNSTSSIPNSASVNFILDFGDGTSTTSAWNNTHNYSAPGQYNTSLTMEVYDTITNNVLCTSYAYDTIVISSNTSCNASFQYTQATSGSLTINFQSTGTSSSSVSTYDTYVWDFGDNNTSTQQNPSHTYISSGSYMVNLTHEVRSSATNSIICSDDYEVRHVSPGSIDTCEATIYYQQSLNNLSVSFNAYGSKAVSYNQVVYPGNFYWDFGDGNIDSGIYTTHTYAAPGSYPVTLIMEAPDSINQTLFCVDTVVMTVVVTTPPLQCNAFFAPDSSTIGTPDPVIYNYSSPSTSPGISVSYHWDFGDGDSSSLAFPSHTYPGPGTYNLCLTMVVMDAQNRYCTDSHCNTITLDSAGNFQYKSTGSPFTINIQDPNSVGEEEHALSDLEVFPNPATDRVNISGLSSDANWSLYNLSGVQVDNGNISLGENSIELPDVASGLYLLKVSSAGASSAMKLQISR